MYTTSTLEKLKDIRFMLAEFTRATSDLSDKEIHAIDVLYDCLSKEITKLTIEHEREN